MLESLQAQAGITPYVILQKLGDAVLVPAGCAHQVRNLRSSIKVAADFVAPEHVKHCVRLTEDLRQLPASHHRRIDVLNVRSILFYAGCAAVAALEEHKQREEARKAKQRREVRRSLSGEPQSPRAAAAAAAAGPSSLGDIAMGDAVDALATALYPSASLG